MELLPLEYSLEKQFCVMESRVLRTLLGMSPPNEAMHAANAFVANSLCDQKEKNIMRGSVYSVQESKMQ